MALGETVICSFLPSPLYHLLLLMDNIKNQKPRRWLKIASYLGLGLLALETALLVGAGVVGCSQKVHETQVSDGVRTISPIAKPFYDLPTGYDAFPNLLEQIPNDDVYANVNVEYYEGNYQNTKLFYDTYIETRLIVLPVGRYYIGAQTGHAYGWTKYFTFAEDRILFYGLRSMLRSVSDTGVQQVVPNTYWATNVLASPSEVASPFFVSITSPTAYLFTCREIDMPFVYVIDDNADVSDVTYNLPSTYDFRRWVANVDPATGCLSLESRWDNGIGFRNFVFPFVWRAGDGKVYNYIYLNVVGVDGEQALIVNGNGDAKVASNIFGSNWTKFSMLMTIRFGFAPNYDGSYIEKQNEALSTDEINPLYYADVYRNTLVSGTLDGQGLSAFDCRAVMIPAMYRFFDVYQDRGVVFSTPNYSNVTTGELLNMDLNSVVVLGDISSSPMSMLTQGFNAIASILAIQILPNVTLGLLLFIPLIVTVILVIVRLLQK